MKDNQDGYGFSHATLGFQALWAEGSASILAAIGDYEELVKEQGCEYSSGDVLFRYLGQRAETTWGDVFFRNASLLCARPS